MLCTIDLKVLRRSEILLNFSIKILFKFILMIWKHFSLQPTFHTSVLTFVRFLLLLRLLLIQQVLVWYNSVSIFLLWHISSVASLLPCITDPSYLSIITWICVWTLKFCWNFGDWVLLHLPAFYTVSLYARIFLSFSEIASCHNIWEASIGIYFLFLFLLFHFISHEIWGYEDLTYWKSQSNIRLEFSSIISTKIRYG